MSRQDFRSKRFGALLVWTMVLVLALAVGALAQTRVVIGMLGPLSGDYASYGLSVANGVELAINEANASGQYDYVFVLQREDTAGTKCKLSTR